VVSDLLSVDDLRNGAGEACTLSPGANSPAPVPSFPQKSAAVAPGEHPGELAELFDDSRSRVPNCQAVRRDGSRSPTGLSVV
jgi:hypothetical protein